MASGAPVRPSSVDAVSASIPIFPLNTVVMPGQVLPLRIFEERYLAMLEHLQQVDDPAHEDLRHRGARAQAH